MFAEPLPDNCPPSEATEREEFTGYRLLDSKAPCHADFASHAARWPQRYGDKCRHYGDFSTITGTQRLLVW